MEFLNIIDWTILFKIIMVNIILSGDNALVIAVACSQVPAVHRAKTVFWGTVMAIVARIVVLICAAWLMQWPFIKLIAGLGLLYIGYGLAVGGDDHEIEAKDSMFAAIKTIAIADLIMSIDNVFAIIGASHTAGDYATFYAIGGILMSIPLIIFGATLIGKLIERFPVIVWFGAGLVAWIGGEMIATDVKINFDHQQAFVTSIITTVGVLGLSYIVHLSNKKKEVK